MAVTREQLRAALADVPAGFLVDHNEALNACVYLNENYTFFGSEGNRKKPSGGQATLEERVNSLVKWIEKYGLGCSVYNENSPPIFVNTDPAGARDQVALRLQRPPTVTAWIVGDPEAINYYEEWVRPSRFLCPYCNLEHASEVLVCPESGRLTFCTSCYSRTSKVKVLETDNLARRRVVATACGLCQGTCSHADCDEVKDDTRHRYCSDHAHHARCVACRVGLEWVDAEHEPTRCNLRQPPIWEVNPALHDQMLRENARYNAVRRRNEVVWGRAPAPDPAPLPPSAVFQVQEVYEHVCPGCEETQLCRVCNTAGPDRRPIEYSPFHDALACSKCLEQARMLVVEDSFPAEEDNDSVSLLEKIPGRESIRLCGVEIEGGHGTQTNQHLIQAFRLARLTSQRELAPYHGNSQGFVTVERDSSVDWEAVTRPFNPASEEDMQHLNETMRIIRKKVRAGELKFDLRCGVHIHVSADGVGLTQAYNLSHVHTYIEDPFFRISSAKWPVHRACHSLNSARALVKHARKTDFYNQQGGRGGGHDDHYFSLSFQNYFAAMLRQCQCGAREMGIWDECTCRLKKCTFEFRLFNATANSKKLLAYLALCQALVAYAIALPEPRNPTTEWPGLPFNRTPLKSMSDLDRSVLTEAWLPRLKFIMNDLPLTPEEREAVRYCMLNSEIAVGLGDEVIHLLENPENRR